MEGCTNVGRTGWHIDGSFQERPFSHSIYHIIECPTDGATVFAPLNELIERLDEKKKAFWHRLYMASDRQRYTYRVLQTIQMNLILLCVWADQAVLGSAKTALKFEYEI